MDNIRVDILSAFKTGLDAGFFNGSDGLKDFDAMNEEEFQAYRQGYQKGVDLYIASIEREYNV